MHIYQQIYEFAASAGALEGYVYRKNENDLDMDALQNWVDNIFNAYQHLSPEVREKFQTGCDQTLGRALRSLVPVLGRDHNVIRKLKSIAIGKLPESADDFTKDKWFEEKSK